MDSRTLLTMLIPIAAGSLPLLARDPGPVETRSRPSDGFVPERVDTSKLHGPVARPRDDRPLYERVEEDIDRGNGRVEDEQTYEVRRLQDSRDERAGRIEPRRESDRVQEELDRRLRLERQSKRSQSARRDTKAPEDGIVVEITPAVVESTLARFVKEQEQLLEAARERYQADLRTAEVERDDVTRAANASRQARALANRRFQERRAVLTRAYQTERRKILGNDD